MFRHFIAEGSEKTFDETAGEEAACAGVESAATPLHVPSSCVTPLTPVSSPLKIEFN